VRSCHAHGSEVAAAEGREGHQEDPRSLDRMIEFGAREREVSIHPKRDGETGEIRIPAISEDAMQ